MGSTSYCDRSLKQAYQWKIFNCQPAQFVNYWHILQQKLNFTPSHDAYETHTPECTTMNYCTIVDEDHLPKAYEHNIHIVIIGIQRKGTNLGLDFCTDRSKLPGNVSELFHFLRVNKSVKVFHDACCSKVHVHCQQSLVWKSFYNIYEFLLKKSSKCFFGNEFYSIIMCELMMKNEIKLLEMLCQVSPKLLKRDVMENKMSLNTNLATSDLLETRLFKRKEFCTNAKFNSEHEFSLEPKCCWSSNDKDSLDVQKFIGFQTASGKDIKVSQSALNAAQKCFEKCIAEGKTSYEQENIVPMKRNHEIHGFGNMEEKLNSPVKFKKSKFGKFSNSSRPDKDLFLKNNQDILKVTSTKRKLSEIHNDTLNVHNVEMLNKKHKAYNKNIVHNCEEVKWTINFWNEVYHSHINSYIEHFLMDEMRLEECMSCETPFNTSLQYAQDSQKNVYCTHAWGPEAQSLSPRKNVSHITCDQFYNKQRIETNSQPSEENKTITELLTKNSVPFVLESVQGPTDLVERNQMKLTTRDIIQHEETLNEVHDKASMGKNCYEIMNSTIPMNKAPSTATPFRRVVPMCNEKNSNTIEKPLNAFSQEKRNSSSLQHIGFKTASGKEVKISASAMKNALKMLDDEPLNEKQLEVMPTKLDKKLTCSSKNQVKFNNISKSKQTVMDLSEDVLEAAQKMFDDDCFKDELDTSKYLTEF